MIDIHNHVLPHLDDGAADWDASLAMVRAACQDGIRQVVATPHWTGQEGEIARIREQAEGLRQRVEAEGLPYRIHLGNEVILIPRLVPALKEGEAFTLAGSNYVLLETAQLEHGAYIRSALYQLQSSGYRIILAHPERVAKWRTDLSDLQELMERNCFLQINGTSILGGFGKQVQAAAEQLLKLGWVSALASDAHSPTNRPQLLAEARKRCARIVGDAGAEALVETNPARILANDQLPYPQNLDLPAKRSLFSLPWRR